MVPLNHSLRLLTLLYICSLPLRADVLQFFDPTKEHKPSVLTSKLSYFIANDTISLEEFFGDWQAHYHPRAGKNIAIQDFRVDIGGRFYKDFYLGFFHKYNVFVEANKDFADLYHTIKNKEDFYHDRDYLLNLDIQGVKYSGLVLSKNSLLFKDSENSIMIGGALSLSFGHDIQEGTVRGRATSPSEKMYQVQAQSTYHYTDNHLYDLDVKGANGFGYGADIALAYTNSRYDFGIKLIANDVFSRIYWRDLPYSFVDIQTENKTFDKDGYVKYSPAISGLEKYTDFTQHIEARYKLIFEKKIYEDAVLSGGLARSYGENFPYVRFDEALSEEQDVGFSYESRFDSFGFDYRYKSFMIGLSTDALSDPSVFALRSSFQLQF